MRKMMWRERVIRRLVRSIVGRFVIDGGEPGHLVRCNECHGLGVLHGVVRTSPQSAALNGEQ